MAPSGTIDAAATLGAFRAMADLLEAALKSLRNAWSTVLDKVQAVLRKLEHELNSDSPWASVLEFFTDDLKDCISVINSLIGQLKTKVEEILDKVGKAVGGSAPVLSLLDTSVQYNPGVIEPFSNISTKMSANDNIVYWAGPTRQAYDIRVKEQSDAAAAVTEKMIATSAWLAEVGVGNLTYITELGKKAAEVAGTMVTAAIDAGMTISGILTQAPLALKDLSDVVGEAVNQIMQWGLDLVNHLGTSVQKVSAIANARSNNLDLGDGGSWPTIKS